MIQNTFTPALYNVIAEQRLAGIICDVCTKTEIEHTFLRMETCGEFRAKLSATE